MKETGDYQINPTTPLHEIDDGQINDEYYLLSPHHGYVDRETKQILTIVKNLLPYNNDDFRRVEVKPYKDAFVDYTHVTFELSAVMEQELFYNEEETTVFVEKIHARTLAQVGVLFDLVPEALPFIEIPPAEGVSLEDELETLWNPMSHAPDLPVQLSEAGPMHYPTPIRENKKKPPYERKRKNPRKTEDLP